MLFICQYLKTYRRYLLKLFFYLNFTLWIWLCNMSENILEHCTNCKHEVPVGNLEMHIIYCKRNIQLCPICDERVLRSELENHNKDYHSLMTCCECNIKFQSSELEDHKKNFCKKRIMVCQYCNLELKADDISEHEDYCGSRTERCNECGRHIMLKFQHLHLDSNHKFIKLKDNDSLSDSDDEDLVMKTDERYNVSPRRRTTKQKHLRFSDDNPFVNKSPSSKQNGLNKKKIKSHREDELSEYFKNMDIENGPTNAATSEINEILSRERSSFQDTRHPWLVDETLIPCEFCKAPVDADNLVLHQTGCRPDLSSMQSSYSVDKNPYQSYVRSLRREGIREINTDSDEDLRSMSQVAGADEAIIPCEFCLQHFSLDDISGHQYLCRRNTSVPR